MAKELSGDWRDPERIRAWAASLAPILPTARPRAASDPQGWSIWLLLAHAVGGWAACAVVMGLLMWAVGVDAAIIVHAIAAPVIFGVVSYLYFSVPGTREPLMTALVFTATVTLLDAVVVAGAILRDFAMFTSIAGTWLPFALIFVVTWVTGAILRMMPPRRPAKS
jgi:hypothetical protein